MLTCLTRYLIQFLENLLVIPHSTVVPGSSSSTGSAFGIITRYIVVKLLSRVESFPHSNFVTGLSVASRFTESSRVPPQILISSSVSDQPLVKKMRVLLRHHLVVLLFFLATYIQLATCELVTDTKVATWSNSLASKFANFLDVTMGMPKLQKMYDDVPRTTTTKEGRVLAASAAAQLASLLNDKDSELRLLAKKCSEKSTTKEMIQSTQISIVKKLQDQGDDQIMRAYFTSHDDGTMVLHSVPGHTSADEVAPTASTAGYIPIHPPSGEEKSDPAFPFVTTAIYDARRTSWYSNAVAGPKDVFVVVDETNMGSDASRWDALKSTLQHVLNTISPNDNVWIHRRTGTKTTEKKTNEESIAEAAPPLLTPLGGKSCLGGHVRGKASVVQQLSDAVQKMQISTTLASAPASDADDWLNMLNTTMHAVDYVRTNHVSNAERAGVILLLSTGGMESQSVQDAVVPFVLDQNVHRFPIVALHIAEKVAAAPSAEKLAYSCTDLGSSAWMTSSSHPADAGLYYEHIVEAPSTDSSSQRDPLTSRLSSVSILMDTFALSLCFVFGLSCLVFCTLILILTFIITFFLFLFFFFYSIDNPELDFVGRSLRSCSKN